MQGNIMKKDFINNELIKMEENVRRSWGVFTRKQNRMENVNDCNLKCVKVKQERF